MIERAEFPAQITNTLNTLFWTNSVILAPSDGCRPAARVVSRAAVSGIDKTTKHDSRYYDYEFAILFLELATSWNVSESNTTSRWPAQFYAERRHYDCGLAECIA